MTCRGPQVRPPSVLRRWTMELGLGASAALPGLPSHAARTTRCPGTSGRGCGRRSCPLSCPLPGSFPGKSREGRLDCWTGWGPPGRQSRFRPAEPAPARRLPLPGLSIVFWCVLSYIANPLPFLDAAARLFMEASMQLRQQSRCSFYIRTFSEFLLLRIALGASARRNFPGSPEVLGPVGVQYRSDSQDYRRLRCLRDHPSLPSAQFCPFVNRTAVSSVVDEFAPRRCDSSQI